MGKITDISWTDATWNIARGCTKVDEDCKFCYMYRESLNSTRYNPLKVVRTKTVFNLPLKLKEPSKIFTSSLTDFFHEDCDAFRDEAWDIIRKCPQHTFQILTKRPERIGNKTLPFENGGLLGGVKMDRVLYRNLPNVWIGTSVGHQNGMYRIKDLLVSPWRGLKFLSLEPLHGPINLFDARWMRMDRVKEPPISFTSGIKWVIVGGESGNEIGKYRYRECKIEWIEDIVGQCKEAGIPVFVKQLGTFLSKKMDLKDRHGRDMTEWPERLRVRQFPN